MKLKDLIDLICCGQNIEIIDNDTEEKYYKGYIDFYRLDIIYDCLSNKKVASISSSNDFEHDDYIIIWVS